MSNDSSDDDRRLVGRQPIELKVEYKRLNSFFSDYTRNISRGGTFIKTNRPLPVGTEFVFKLSVPQLTKPISIHGEVQWVVGELEAVDQNTDPGMGIRFVYRQGDSQEEIARVVEGLMVESLGQRLYAKLMEQSRQRG